MNYKELDPEQFNLKDCIISGDDCVLITPKDMSTKWTDENARYRSCIVRKSDGFVISQGFGKFTNFGERPEFQPWDESWKIEARHKLDGSLLIVSEYKGEIIARTRGTIDARQMANGNEIDILIEKYPVAFDNFWFDMGWTLLFEWTTPSNIIVLRENEEPTLTLVGMVHNETGKYASQGFLDTVGLPRPQKYEYNSVAECIADVTAWTGKEGVVLYSPDGQTLKKIKASSYCELHKLATGIKNYGHVVSLFMETERFTKYEDFYKYVETTLDFEVAEKIKDDMEKVVTEYNLILFQCEEVEDYVSKIRNGFERREQAKEITHKYLDWRKSYAFSVLDNKELDEHTLKKLLLNK